MKMSTIMPATAGVMFDLDYCMFDTSSMEKGLVPVFQEHIRTQAGFQNHNEDDVVSFIWSSAPDVVVTKFGLAEDEMRNFLDFYAELPIPREAKLYADVIQTLEQLQSAGVPMFLVTKGEGPFQERKVAHCGIGHFFEEVIVVGNRCPKFATKFEAFKDIFDRNELNPANTWVVGDGREEIDAGLELGCLTAQTLRPTVMRLNQAHQHINSLEALLPLVGVR